LQYMKIYMIPAADLICVEILAKVRREANLKRSWCRRDPVRKTNQRIENIKR
jgi:hypothetical protein